MISAALTLAALSGCTKPPATSCRSDAECPGGACVVGQCRMTVAPDLSAAGGGGDMGARGDMTTQPPDGWSPDAIAASCTTDNDGVLTRAELPIAVGLGGLFAVNAAQSTVPVNVVPQMGAWDFSSPISNERKVFDQLVAPSGTWWASDFPSATYAERLDDSSGLFGIYQATNDSLLLLGIVSESDAFPQTSLKYDTPIALLKLPMKVGDKWTAESDVSGLYMGAAVVGDHEQWDINVDVRATTKVPLGSFDTLRLRINYTQTYGFATTTRIILLHMAECYGAVARVRSQDNESSPDFTMATEYRRLTVP